jgi:bifunctional non-homologous end joining protein LigD
MSVLATGPVAKANFIAPMKALGTTVLPAGIWHCEIKFDGYRCVAVLSRGRVELWSRSRKSMTADFPQVVSELRNLKCRDAIIDGEMVGLDPKGRSRFQLLQNRGAAGTPPSIAYFAFDLMRLNGASLLASSLEDRIRLLRSLVGRGGRQLKLSTVFKTEPRVLFAAAKKNGLEGIIAKKPGSHYEPDLRSGAWLKCKIFAEQEFVIGGFTRPRNSRKYLGAIMVGYFDGGRLRYAGKVGTGFDERALAALHGALMGKKAARCPFADLPSLRRARFGAGMGPAEMKRVTWARPALVAQVKFSEWTGDGLLRQPVFLGLRRDKPARDVVREAGPAAKAR